MKQMKKVRESVNVFIVSANVYTNKSIKFYDDDPGNFFV